VVVPPLVRQHETGDRQATSGTLLSMEPGMSGHESVDVEKRKQGDRARDLRRGEQILAERNEGVGRRGEQRRWPLGLATILAFSSLWLRGCYLSYWCGRGLLLVVVLMPLLIVV